jgi:hypothetical protein
VDSVLGLLALLVFIVCVIAFAAGITWIVVKVSPNPEDKKTKEEAAA